MERSHHHPIRCYQFTTWQDRKLQRELERRGLIRAIDWNEFWGRFIEVAGTLNALFLLGYTIWECMR